MICRCYVIIVLLLFVKSSIQRVISFTDQEIEYFGRWQKTLTDIRSVSSGAYLKTTVVYQQRFRKQQQKKITLILSKPATVFIQIDKDQALYKAEAVDQGIYPIELIITDDMVPFHRDDKMTITFLSDITSSICLQAIEINDDIVSINQANQQQQQQLIEFVGHDLTLGLGTTKSLMTSFPWLVSTLLGTERSQIAFQRAWLIDHGDANGMETRYFLGESFQWPDVVVILLGEYDEYQDVYHERMVDFLKSVRQRFPQTIIIVLSEPLGVLFQESQSAVHTLNDVYSNQNVYFVDTTGWIQFSDETYTDPLHLNDVGQEKFAQKLAPLLKSKLLYQPFPGPQPNPNLPYNWQTIDVGQKNSIGLVGSVSFDSVKAFTLWGSGEGFSNKDAFRFVYQAMSGDGSIQVTIESHAAFAACAKAGIMMREHLAYGSPNMMLGFTPEFGLFLQTRMENMNNTNLLKKRNLLSPPFHLRLTRQGKTKFIAQISHNGAIWETIHEVDNLLMARDIYVGLAVTSCDPSVVSVAKFTDVTLFDGTDSGFYLDSVTKKQQGLIMQLPN